MNNSSLWQKAFPHLIAVVSFIILSLAYMSPVLQGKKLDQHDVKQSIGASHQGVQYKEKTGEQPFWVPNMFSGMPSYLIFMDYPSSISVHIARILVYSLPEPANLVFLYLLGAYIGLCLMGFNPWIASLGAVGYAFGAYNLINIAAGHISKCIGVATIPMVIGAVVYTYQSRKYLWGGIMVAFFAAIHQYSNFIQMTYYLAIGLGIFVIVRLVMAISQKQIKDFILASVVVMAGGLLSLGNHASRYLTTFEYSQKTIRGKSDLSDSPENIVAGKKVNTSENPRSGGLDKDYAFRWSYGIGETFNLLIPNFNGSLDRLDAKSKTARVFASNGLDASYAQQIPTYWGNQPYTAGPAYFGAAVIFLFVLGMIISRSPLKWWCLAATIFLISLAWGKNFFLNDLLFDTLPLYNKFRAVTMVLAMVPIFLMIVIGLGLKEVFAFAGLSKESELFSAEKKRLLNALKYAVIATAGITLVFALLGGFFMDFASNNPEMIDDNQLRTQLRDETVANQVISALRSDRQNAMQTDAWRSTLFVLLAAGIVWAFLQKQVNTMALGIGLILITLIDLWAVDRRYLNNDNFVPKSQAQKIEMTPADQQILQDAGYYRVFKLPGGQAFNDASTSYYHNSIGGYHAAKLRRYQDLISTHISTEEQAVLEHIQKEGINLLPNQGYKPVLNMLNVKYFIISKEMIRQPNDIVIPNPDAAGPAWLLNKYRIVANADEELKAVGQLAIKQEAIIDKKFEKVVAGSALRPDLTATIQLTDRSPNKMVYQTNAQAPQLAVFSEIYYNSEIGWKSFIDGKEVNHARVNYILRGLVVPAGKHTIEFRFVPSSYKKGELIGLITSILLVVGLIAAIVLEWRKSKLKKGEQ